jgi:hypothetical protein
VLLSGHKFNDILDAFSESISLLSPIVTFEFERERIRGRENQLERSRFTGILSSSCQPAAAPVLQGSGWAGPGLAAVPLSSQVLSSDASDVTLRSSLLKLHLKIPQDDSVVALPYAHIPQTTSDVAGESVGTTPKANCSRTLRKQDYDLGSSLR